jgi:hypothetical protein
MLFKYCYYDMYNWVGCRVLTVADLCCLHLQGTIMMHDIWKGGWSHSEQVMEAAHLHHTYDLLWNLRTSVFQFSGE